MKNTSLLTVATAAASALTLATAHASPFQNATYLKIDGGAAWTQSIDISIGSKSGNLKTKSGYGFNGVLGMYVDESLALEFEAGYQENDFRSFYSNGSSEAVVGNVSVIPLLANVAWTPKLTNSISGQFSLGGGANVINEELTTSFRKVPGETKAVLGGQAKSGLSYQISDTISADLNYRLRVMDGPGYATGLKNNSVVSHLVTAGFSFKF